MHLLGSSFWDERTIDRSFRVDPVKSICWAFAVHSHVLNRRSFWNAPSPSVVMIGLSIRGMMVRNCCSSRLVSPGTLLSRPPQHPWGRRESFSYLPALASSRISGLLALEISLSFEQLFAFLVVADDDSY
jgi:hypothetical protein